MLERIKRKLVSNKKINTVFVFIFFLLITFTSIGYSALSQNLMITGDVDYLSISNKLYDVFKRAARTGTYVKEYTGSHQDSYASTGTKKIYYWYGSNDTNGTAIQNMNNVIFAGHCWQMIRTTDTGGVKMIYNGEAENNQCLNTRGIHVGYNERTTQDMSTTYYYATSYSYNSTSDLFSLSGIITTGEIRAGEYTCRGTSPNGTCETLYYVESVKTGTTYNVIPLTSNSHYSQFGTLQYNSVANSLAYSGYMYNSVHPIASVYNAFTIAGTTPWTIDTSYYYSDTIDYNSNTYTLTNPSLISTLSDYNTLVGKYILSTSGTSASTARYVVAVSENNVYYRTLSSGNLNTSLTIGDSYTESGGVYTLTNPTNITYINWYNTSNFSTYKGKYVCDGNNTSCTELKHICTGDNSSVPNPTQNSYYYFSSSNTYSFAQDVSYSGGTYTLTGDIKTNWDFYDSASQTMMKTHHYTCLENGTSCTTVNHVISMDYGLYYIPLAGGETIDTAINTDLYANDVNDKNSTIKTGIDAWYVKYLSNYDIYIEDTIFCNDRTILSLGGWDPDGGDITAGSQSLYFQFQEATPTTDLSCDRITDKFSTLNNSAKLTYKVGLMSNPEMNLLNNNNARRTGQIYWTGSPIYLPIYYLHNAGINSTGALYSNRARYANGVRPAISLVPDIEFISGDGSMASPYIVDAESTQVNPNEPTITGGTTKVYGSSTTTLTCTTSTTYENGMTPYYSFGYADSDGGTPGNWTIPSTTNTLTLSSTEYLGQRWYSCRVYAVEGANVTETAYSSLESDAEVTINNATLSFNTTVNGGTGGGTVYARNGESVVYTEIRGSTTGTIPSAHKEGYTFNGWYTASTGGDKVLNSDGTFTGTAVSGYTTTSAWALLENKTLYAQFTIIEPDTPTISGGAIKVYGSSDTTLTCATTTIAGNGWNLYYSFGYADSDGGTPGNWTTASTTNTLTIGATEYLDQRWYSCRVYTSHGEDASSTITSLAADNTEMTINNATLTFDAVTNGGTGGGTVYTKVGETGVYTGIRDTVDGTIPTVTPATNYALYGWYTLASGGDKVLNSDGSFTGTAVSGYTTASAWDVTEDKTLYARYGSFATDSWETIVANVASGNTSHYAVGNTKSVSMGSSLGTHTLRIANKSTPSACSGTNYSQTACGFVLEFADLLGKRVMHSSSTNKGGWPGTTMRTYVNGTVYNALPEALRNGVINTKVISGHGSTSGETNFTSTDKLYYLSMVEVYGDNYGGKDTVTTSITRKLDYYTNAGVTSSSYSGAIKKNSGTATIWLMRSAYSSSTTYYTAVTTAGKQDYYSANTAYGVAPAFRLGVVTPTISGGETKVYESSDTTLTCSSSVDYGEGMSIYYSFGYADSNGGTPGNWSTASTTNTFTVPSNEYVGQRWYSCRIYVTNGVTTGDTVASLPTADTEVTFNNATLTFDATTNGGTGGGTAYTKNGATDVYTGILDTTVGTVPTAAKTGYTFSGWYDAASGGNKVLNVDGTFTGTAVAGYTNSNAWAITEDKTLYAQFTQTTYSIAYVMNGGVIGNSAPAIGVYDANVEVSMPSKNFTLNFDANSQGVSITSGGEPVLALTESQTFDGWTSADIDTTTAKYGASSSDVTTLWADGTVKVGASNAITYFQNLRSDSGTANLTANWTTTSIALPKVEKSSGYTCSFNTESDGSGTSYASEGSYTPSTTAGSDTLYARCVITDPEVPTISGGETKIYGSNSTTLTCATSSTVPSGWNIYYSFGYADSDGGTPENWTADSISDTLTISATEYVDQRWYSCRAYISDGIGTSNTITSLATADTEMTINNATLTFDATTNSGTGGGTVYTKTGDTEVYTGIRNATVTTIPTATMAKSHIFFGWYTLATGGEKVLNNDGTFTGTAVAGYTTEDAWALTENKTLYAQYSSFATDSWETIVANVASGNAAHYSVGDTKSVSMGSSLGTHTLRIANKSTPSACSGTNYSQTACGFVLEFADLLGKRVMHSSSTNKGGWPGTTMRTYVNGTVYNALPEALRNGIINTKVISGHGSTSGETNFTSTDKLYYLSMVEVYGDNYGGKDTVTTSITRKLDYYSNIGVTSSSYSGAIKKNSGTATIWLMRSAYSSSTTYYTAVTTAGKQDYYSANTAYGVAPAFRLGVVTPTISGGETKIYGSSDTTLTCSSSVDYGQGMSTYYSFGYADSDGGTPDNWSTASTSNTFTVSSTEYVGQRWYSCRMYVTNGTTTGDTVASLTTADTEVTINNVALTFDATTNGGTGGGTVYTKTGATEVYTGIGSETVGTIPTATPVIGYEPIGWYDAASGGNKVLNADGTFTGTAVEGYTSSNAWAITEDKTLYAQYGSVTYNISYTMNGATAPNVTSVAYDSDAVINQPSKTFTVNIDANTQGASITSGGNTVSEVSSVQTFAGWTASNIDTATALYGSSADPTTPWDGITKVGSSDSTTYFKNLRSLSGTAVLVANWTSVAVTLPKIEKEDHICGYATSASGFIVYGSEASYIPSITSGSTTLYARCVSGKVSGTMTLSPSSGTLTYGTDEIVTIVTDGDGALSCSSSDEDIATCSISGTTLTITPQANVDDSQVATITVLQAEGEIYIGASATYTATVDRQTLTCPSSPAALTYNGSPQTSGVTCPTGSTEGGTTSATTAGSYSQTCTATTGYKFSSACSVPWTINKKATTMSLSSTSATIDCDDYVTVTVTSDGDGTLTCSTSNSNYATCSVIATNKVRIYSGGASGTATITIRKGEGTNYLAASKTFSAKGKRCITWTYYASWGDAASCTTNAYCPQPCSYHGYSYWSCTDGSTPTAPSQRGGGECWCGS